MIRIEDFNKAVEFIQKKAKERDIEITQIDEGYDSFVFCGKTREYTTPNYAEINIKNGGIRLIPPLVDKESFFKIRTDGTVVQISSRDYDDYDYDYDYDYDDDYDDDDIYDDEDEW